MTKLLHTWRVRSRCWSLVLDPDIDIDIDLDLDLDLGLDLDPDPDPEPDPDLDLDLDLTQVTGRIELFSDHGIKENCVSG
jgi:hypothetical protein